MWRYNHKSFCRICDDSLVLRWFQVLYDIRLTDSAPPVSSIGELIGSLLSIVSAVNLKGLLNSPCTYEACLNMDWKDLGLKPSNAHKPPLNIRTWKKQVLMRPLEIAETVMRHWSSQMTYGCLILIELLDIFILASWCEICLSTSGLC